MGRKKNLSVDKKEENVKTFGKVINCNAVYVREEPRIDSDPITYIVVDSQVEIIDSSNSDFYKIVTEIGAEGYICKDFIEVVI